MSQLTTTMTEWTIGDLFARFGSIPYRRICQQPPPGLGTEQDVCDLYEQQKRLYELSDGVLVEKTVGVQEAFLAMFLGGLLREFVARQGSGFLLGPDGMIRLGVGLVRIPDISFFSWQRFPLRKVPRQAMMDVAPELAIEVLSASNTSEEMAQKLHDYFAAGVQIVWYVDPVQRTVEVFNTPTQATLLRETESLTGDPLLPGFVLPLADLFAELET